MPQPLNFPLIQEIPWQDPAQLFNVFAKQPGALFLDSAQQMSGYGEYSFIGIDPFLTFTSKDKKIQLGDTFLKGNPFTLLKEQLSCFTLPRLPNLPPFQGGVAGYLGYELLTQLEKILLPKNSTTPDMWLGFYDLVIGFDLSQQRAWIFSSGYPEQQSELRQHRAQTRLHWLQSALKEVPILPIPPRKFCSQENIQSNFNETAYQQAVQRVIDYILAGDIFQANIAQCFTSAVPENFSPLSLYLRLRQVNPSLFSAYINTGDTILASASPERFLKLTADQVITCPIKGTRPRGTTPTADLFYKNELLMSEKDRAENTMIVDLLRNDLAKVCKNHSIQIPHLCDLESFASVHHLVSVVTGELKPEHDAIDLLCATFPGGSITGAPKVRAMEIIAEIEQHARGPYCGSICYISFNGDMDSSIVIRTFVIDANTISFHAGGGIVADSNPAQEYAETLTKANALYRALTE